MLLVVFAAFQENDKYMYKLNWPSYCLRSELEDSSG